MHVFETRLLFILNFIDFEQLLCKMLKQKKRIREAPRLTSVKKKYQKYVKVFKCLPEIPGWYPLSCFPCHELMERCHIYIYIYIYMYIHMMLSLLLLVPDSTPRLKAQMLWWRPWRPGQARALLKSPLGTNGPACPPWTLVGPGPIWLPWALGPYGP